jgi:DegV family protein with EDD domain
VTGTAWFGETARMVRRVAVVTDSTACLPADLARELGITVVPLQVMLGSRTVAEDELPPGELVAFLAEPRARATTSQPSPAAFAAAFDAAFERAESVVAVHLSGRLSGTVGASQSAATSTGRDVRVVDARSTGMGLGFVALAAARAAVEGAPADEVVAAATAAIGHTRTLFYVDTLEHLRRGGRIGRAAALVGTALSVKPILHVVDGEIAPLDKVRTASKAIARLQELVVAEAGDAEVDLAVHHLAAPERAAAVVAGLRAAVPGVRDVVESEIGAVIGAHTGPGVLGVVVHRR